MDIYGALDLISVLIAAVVAIEVKNFDTKLLAWFFTLSSIASFFLFQTDYYSYWFYFFAPICFICGLLCASNGVALGFASMLVVIGLDQLSSFNYYSHAIYLIFYWQLWKAAHDNFNGGIWRYLASNTHHKAAKG